MKLIASFDRRRRLFLTLVIGTGVLGLVGLFEALALAGVDMAARVPLALLFAMTFTWIGVSFWHAVIGFFLMIMRRDPYTLQAARPSDPTLEKPGPHRTALIMPIYNEDPGAVHAGLAAMASSLLGSGHHNGFEFFVLSDTQNPDLLTEEQAQLARLQKQLGNRLPLHYRHRHNNAGRKAGNIADFCRRWGQCFDFMLVLDADSRMDAASMHRLVARMQADSGLGLIQTVPIPAGQNSVFARVMQFASSLYSPMLATGQAFWQGRAGNYWGHNALIRVSAFTSSCGLPQLPGKPPLGGEILSHDFVEAALMVRAGWGVALDTAMLSSHEEMPANLIDFLARDRRWMQGNLQHLRLLGMTALQPTSRLHFLFGAFAYLSSLAWLGLIAMGLATLIRQPQVAELAHPGLITLNLILLIATLVVLFAPRMLGLLLAIVQRPQAFGGRLRLLLSALMEAVTGVLLAPIMMLFHARFALEIFSGASAGWSSPPRGERGVGATEALARTGLVALLGLAWLIGAATLTPQYLWWMSPVWLGLLMSPLIAWVSGNAALGRGLRDYGLLLTPQEATPSALFPNTHHRSIAGSAMGQLEPPPPERPVDMPTQRIQCDDLAQQLSRLGRLRV
jgi:membrane glycosyltransferase